MIRNNFELSVEVNGRNIPEFGKNGRTYVEGRKNHRYQIKFRNNRAERVLVVPTIDGLSVVDGKAHNDDSPGYVVQAYSSLTISGWRTSMSETREFEFSTKSGSFAGKTEGERNCGVIGAIVYGEESSIKWSDIHIHHHHFPPPPPQPTWPYPSYTIRCASNTAGQWSSSLKGDSSLAGEMMKSADDGPVQAMYCSMQNASNPDFNLGTSYGAPVQDQVTSVTFEKGRCLATLEIYYSDRKGLLKAGIQVDKTPELARFPQAFGGFCKLPS